VQLINSDPIQPIIKPMLKAPFPWFGGKSRVASIVWRHFGDVKNYVEPFAGSLAVLLGRPTPPKIETVNDLDCYLANFWRALKFDPAGTAAAADWPVNEADLHARHKWLINQADFRERMHSDPDYYDVKIAGWWVWGLCAWIGDGWCGAESRKLIHLGDAGRGVHRKGAKPAAWFDEISDRLRRVRVACGDWARVAGPSVTLKHGLTGVFLDPPYASERAGSYTVDSYTVAHDVRAWAIENGDNPLMRIALCGYEGEHDMPEGWLKIAWKTQGGYSNKPSDRGRENSEKERIWFSPHCLQSVKQRDLFCI